MRGKWSHITDEIRPLARTRNENGAYNTYKKRKIGISWSSVQINSPALHGLIIRSNIIKRYPVFIANAPLILQQMVTYNR